MFLILTGTSIAALIATKIMLVLGMQTLWLRYLISATFSYAFFLILVKIWLIYILPSAPAKTSSGNSMDVSNADLSGINLPVSISGDASVDSISGGGGEFWGAGASASWDSSGSGSSGSSDFSLPDVDVGDGEGAGVIIVLIIAGALLAVVFGGGIFLIYQAPQILSEAAFQMLLTGGLIRSARNMSSGDWVGSVLRRTWIPFALIALISVILGFAIEHFCPGSHRLMDAIRSCA